MSPRRAKTTRWLIAGGGVAVLLALSALAYARRVDPVEVTATLLFVPVFAGAVLWRLPGGLAAAVAAAVAYMGLRYPAIQIVGADRFAGLIATRTAAYLAFGGIGGWAMGRVRRSMEKLDLYDQLDDATGLGNARHLAHSLELETSRSQRYRTLFSAVVADVTADALSHLGLRGRRRLLRDLGAQVRDLVRTVDRAAHARDGEVHRLAVVLPETGHGGAEVFRNRFHDWLVGFLDERGVTPEAAHVRVAAYTYPDDDDELAVLRASFEALADSPVVAEGPT